jgi:hypothetical protein
LRKATSSMKKFGRNLQRTGQNLTRNLTFPIVAMGAASVKAFDTQQKAIAQVEAGLISTGQAAGFTSKELQKMASDLQAKTLFGDEVILKDATAQLLTFTNIAGEQFARTQKAALNLATRLDGDLKSASIQLGKALNDPIANLSALSRSGIQFSKDQKEVIKSLAETGRLAEAQTIILDELEKQYGGAAEAARLAGLGPFQALQMVLSDLSEEFGALIMENLEPFRLKVEQIIKFIQNLTQEQRRTLVSFAGYAAVIGPALFIIGKLSIAIAGLLKNLRLFTLFMATNPFALFAVAVSGLVSIMGFAILDTEKFIKTALKMGRVGKFIAKVVLGALAAISPKYAAYFAVLDDVSEELDEQEKNLKNSTKEVDANKDAVDKLTKAISNLNIETGKGKTIKVAKTFEEIESGLDALDLEEIVEEEELEEMGFDTAKVVENLNTMQNAMMQTSNVFSSSFNSMKVTAETTFADIGKAALNSARDVIKSAIGQAIASQIAKIIATIPFPFNVAIAAGAGTAVGALFDKAIPAFANGGIVSGPTLGLMGEYAGANTNPEVIAPLDKLQSMIGQGQGSVEVFGRISGSDILISTDRARKNRDRTRGY